MKAIVVYQSKTGFTKQYAEWIAQALGGEAHPLNGLTANALESYDTIVFGGWVMAGMIQGWKKMKALASKPVALFAVTAAPVTDAVIAQLSAANGLEDLPLFCFQGGLRYDKMGCLSRLMMKMMSSSLKNKKNATEEELTAGRMMSASYDHSSRESIMPLIDLLQGGSAEG